MVAAFNVALRKQTLDGHCSRSFLPHQVGVYKSGTVDGGDLETEPPATMPTIRHCLTHTAGFGYGGLFAPFGMVDEVCKSYTKAGIDIGMLGDEMFKRHPTLEHMARTFATVPLRHHPGTTFDYGMGHIISGRCCEVMTKPAPVACSEALQGGVDNEFVCTSLRTQLLDLLTTKSFACRSLSARR
eukprot:SAG31_NODE_1749_length_7358_cov_6.713872_5_plen_185_part_00